MLAQIALLEDVGPLLGRPRADTFNGSRTRRQVSRLEQRGDVLLSTLRKFVEGMGGRLALVAEFPRHNPVRLAGLASLAPAPRKRAKTKRRVTG